MDQVAREFILSPARTGVLYVQGPHNSGKTADALPALWDVAREDGYASIYLMHTVLETALAAAYLRRKCDTSAPAALIDNDLAQTETPTATTATEARLLSIVDYPRFAAHVMREGHLFGDYTKLAVFLDVPSSPTLDFERSVIVLHKILADVQSSPKDLTLRLVCLLDESSPWLFPASFVFEHEARYTISRVHPASVPEYRTVGTPEAEIALMNECLAVAKNARIVSFVERDSLAWPDLDFSGGLLEAAAAQAPAPPDSYAFDAESVMKRRNMPAWKQTSLSVVGIRVASANRFQLPGRTAVVLMGDMSRYVDELDPSTSLVVTHQARISQAELDVQGAFADAARPSRVLCLRDDDLPGQRPHKPQSSAYGLYLGVTVLEMFAAFPDVSYSAMPLNWGETSVGMVRETIRRLVAMGLVERSHGGHRLTQKGECARQILPTVDDKIEVACLVAGALADATLPPAARRVILRLAGVAARPDYCIAGDQDPALGETATPWGPGDTYSVFGLLWVALGLWDGARRAPSGFMAPGGRAHVNAGAFKLSVVQCHGALGAIERWEAAAGLEPTDDLDALALSDAAFGTVNVHLATAFFGRLCCTLDESGSRAAHLVGEVAVGEDDSSFLPLAATTRALRDRHRGLDGRTGTFFFYQSLQKKEKYFFVDATVLSMDAALYFEGVANGDMQAYFQSIAAGRRRGAPEKPRGG